MTRFEATLRAVGKLVEGEEAGWALLGGLAVSARTEPRFTRDIDVAIATDSDDQAEALVGRFVRAGYKTLATVEQTATGRLATARLVPPSEDEDGVVVDLLFASSGIEPEVVGSAEHIEVFANVVIPVASVSALIALKVLSRDDEHRPQDLADLRALLRVSEGRDVEVARQLLERIEERGFARGRDLLAALDSIVATAER